PYIFVAASVISVFAIVFIIKWSMEKMKSDRDANLGTVQQYLFIGVDLAEFIPILLIVYGFMKMETVNEASELFVPIGIIILLVAFAVFFIFMQINVGVPEEMKNQVKTMGLMGISLAAAIPIASIVALFTMMP